MIKGRKMINLNSIKKRFDNYEKLEEKRQHFTLNLTASENIASKYVRSAMASVFANKYSEGRPLKRYYGGHEIIDLMELDVEELARMAFKAEGYHVNVQPYSGSPANFACYSGIIEYIARLKKKQTGTLPSFHEVVQNTIFLGMKLDQGGHLTQGNIPSLTGRIFNFVHYGINRQTYRIDLNEIKELVKKHNPKLITIGPSSYSRALNIFEELAKIAHDNGALFMADIAHTAGLVAAEGQPSPFPHADIVTMTTHKTLRGPRGALIFVKESKKFDSGEKNKKDEPIIISLADMIDKAVFPGLQGGPHDHQTYAIGKALTEALDPKFKKYAAQVVKNIKTLAEELQELGYTIISGGTENHLLVIDLRPSGLSGKEAEDRLAKAGIVANRNAIPFDPAPPWNPSGLRLGTAALTTRGMKEKEMNMVAILIHNALTNNQAPATLKKVHSLCKKFPGGK